MNTLHGLTSIATKCLNTAPVDLQAMADRLTGEDKRQIEETLSGLVQMAAWKWAYINERYGSGCGDQGHDDAVKEANRVLTKVRKAMGFAYPDSGAIRV